MEPPPPVGGVGVEPPVVPCSQGPTQKTLCLVSAPIELVVWMVSLTWKPCFGCGVYVARAAVRS